MKHFSPYLWPASGFSMRGFALFDYLWMRWDCPLPQVLFKHQSWISNKFIMYLPASSEVMFSFSANIPTADTLLNVTKSLHYKGGSIVKGSSDQSLRRSCPQVPAHISLAHQAIQQTEIESLHVKDSYWITLTRSFSTCLHFPTSLLWLLY